MLLALWLVPRHTLTGVRSYAPNSYIMRAKSLVAMTRWAIEYRPREDSLFSHLTLEDIHAMALGCDYSEKSVSNVLNALVDFHRRGIILDVPQVPNEVAPKKVERRRKGEKAPESDSKEDVRWQPFSDEFVTEIGWRSVWIVKNLGPPLLDACDRLWDTSEWGVHAQDSVMNRRQKIMEDIDWRDADGNPLTELPFPIILRDGKGAKAVEVQYWPVRQWPALRQMVTYLQVCHYTILAMTIGARWSEVNAANLDCLIDETDGAEASNASFKSRTYKLVSTIDGLPRVWPLSPDAIFCVRQQQRLARIVGGTNARALWVALNTQGNREGGDRAGVMNENYTRFVHLLGLDHLLGGTRPHTHRWRKTVARLAAMALFDAPRVLMDVFGHKNIEMTLRYILANPFIQAEIIAAAKATEYALSETVAYEAEAANGKAAKRIGVEIRDLRVRSGKLELDVETAREAVDIFNSTGEKFRVVLPAVLCTKKDHETGRCTNNSGEPNVSACIAECWHRMDLERGKREAEHTVVWLAKAWHDETVAGNLAVAECYFGQVVAQIDRYPSLSASLQFVSPDLAAAVAAERTSV